MSAVQGLLALAMLSLMMGKTSAVNETKLRNITLSWSSSRRSQALFDGCLLDIKNPEAYEIKNSMCSRLSARRRAIEPNETLTQNHCWSLFGRPMNVTLYWDRDPSRAASALLAVLLRHVMGFPHVHLVSRMPQYLQSDELIISLATVLEDEHQTAASMLSQMVVRDVSNVPSRRRLHAWLTPAARSRSACRSTNWAFYSNLTALSYCGFIDDLPESYLSNVFMEAMEVFGVGDDCKPTMQRLLQRAKAAGIAARAIFVNRTIFEHELLTSKYSFLFLDFDIWDGEPSVSVVEPPPCASDSNEICQSELDHSIGWLVVDREIKEDYDEFFQLVQNFKPMTKLLRAILEQEANGLNLVEAACEWTESIKSYFSDMIHSGVIKANSSDPIKTYVVTYYVCYTDGKSYDRTINSIGNEIYMKKRALKISFIRYLVNCSEPEHMGSRLDELMQGPLGPNMLGVVSMTVEGAAAASRAAAAHHVPLLFAASVADEGARGASTWLTAGRLRHVTRALHNFVSESGSTRVAVLSQPTTFAQHYYNELQDKAEFFLRNFEVPLNLTEQLAKVVLRELQATETRVVLVNTDSDAAALILGAAVRLNMSYTEGFIWVLREPLTTPKYSTIHFTVSLFNQVDSNGVRRLVQPDDDAIANALLTVTNSFHNIFQRYPYMQDNLHSDQVIRALEHSLTETPVTGINGTQLHYKDRAIEEVNVYVDKWGGYLDTPQRVATWRVNATSGLVRDKDSYQATLDLDFNMVHVPDFNSFDKGVRCDADSGSIGADGGKQNDITSINSPAKTSNTTFVVSQWIQSISKIETSKSDLSESDILKFFKFN